MRAQLLGALVLGTIALAMGGCAMTPSRADWSADATFRPGWTRIRESARAAASDPWVWAPLAGASVFQIDHWDRRTSNWARAHTPIFGSEARANDWSNYLVTTSAVLEATTLLAAPSGDTGSQWLLNKAESAGVELGAIAATVATTEALKVSTNRERPNGSNKESFPSGHTSGAAVADRLAAFNVKSFGLQPSTERAADFGIDAVVIGTAWARVEAGQHYPADTLVGMAIGNFFADFFTRAFLQAQSRSAFSAASTDGGAMVEWHVAF